MLLYTDVLTNDELASDAYDPKLVDDIVYEIDCQSITIKDGEVNIGEWPKQGKFGGVHLGRRLLRFTGTANVCRR